MSDPAYRNPRSRPRVQQETPRRALARAREWARDSWRDAGRSLASPRLKAPSRPVLYRSGAVLGVIALALVVLVAIWDWNWFKGPLERLASARLNRQVVIDGDIDAHLLSWTPRFSAEGLRIADADWSGPGDMASVGRLDLRVRLAPLILGRVEMPLLRLERPTVRLRRDGQGRENWRFSSGPAKPLDLPPIHRFIIRDGHVSFDDVRRRLSFRGAINAKEQDEGPSRGFELEGAGSLNRQPFKLSVTGGPLLNIERDRPYPFDADLRAGATAVMAKGEVRRPFDFGQVYANATVKGADMADLYALTGIVLPNTPPYHLRGRVERDDEVFRVTGLNGRVGDSDLAGRLKVTTGGKRPRLEAKLESRSLDFDDLGAIIGGAPSTRPGEAASVSQKQVAAKLDAQQRLFPDATLQAERIRGLDADVSYQALSIRDAPVPLRSGVVRVKLQAGVLRAEPLRIDLPQGRVAGHVQLDARRAQPVTELDLKLSNARIEQLMPTQGGAPPVVGPIVGSIRLTGTGASVHQAFSSANGEALVAVPGGQIRKAFAELMGINVVKGLGLLLSKNQEKTDLRCAVAHFRTRDGIMTADRVVFDTGPVKGAGGGTINLATERMDMRMKGHAKKFRLVRLLAPITIKGPLRSPKPGVEPGGAIAQGGAAVALGALLSPLASVLPFVAPGGAKDAPCDALLAEAARQGAPLSSVRR